MIKKYYKNAVFFINEKDEKLFERAKKESNDIYFLIEELEFLQVGFIIESDLAVLYDDLIELRNRLSCDGSGKIYQEDHLLLDSVLDLLENIQK